MEDEERERLERILEAVTLTGNAREIRAEIDELRELAEQAEAVEVSGDEAKLSRLQEILDQQEFFADPSKQLLIFTEFRDTLDYLVERFEAWGFRTGYIHGGMKPGSRDEPGSRLHTEQQFRDGDIPDTGGDGGGR